MKDQVTLVKILLIIHLFVLFCIIFTDNRTELKNYGDANKTGLPFNIEHGKNKALLFTMTDEAGRTRNIELIKKVFEDKSLGFSCESYHNRQAPEIYSRIKQATQQLGSDGTLLLYLNSHGGGSGKNFAMTATGGAFKFSKVLESIASVKKVKRLIVLVDTCHAEGAVNEAFQGGAKLVKNMKVEMIELPEYYGGSKTPPFMQFFEKDGHNFYYGKNSEAYEEALIITSSSSKDLSTRGVFAMNFKKAFEETKSNKDAKVCDLLKKFALNHSSGGQQPYYKSIPESILNEPLFKNLLARMVPIKDRTGEEAELKEDYILVP